MAHSPRPELEVAVQTVISLKDASRVESRSLRNPKSAGLAWVLSLVVPGAGHLYAGLYLRGVLVLFFSLAGLAALISVIANAGAGGSSLLAGLLIPLMPVLWVFGFLDAYLTVVESNRGVDPTIVDNPRIAAVLNLTTKGLGYFYLGERGKGIVIFVIMSIVPFAIPVMPPTVAVLFSLLMLGVTVWISVDAYRVGRQAFDAQVATMELPAAPAPSRLPPIVPYVFAIAVAVIVVLFLVVGSLVQVLSPAPLS